MTDNWQDGLRRARDHAPFLARALERRPEIVELLAAGEGEAAMAAAVASGEGIEDTALALRREKLSLALVLAVGDLAGEFPLDRVMQELSDFADRSFDRAIKAAILARMPDADPVGMIGLALGKHGAQELNYSSDIDPILLYDPAILPRRERDEPGEAAQRYAREIVRLMAETTSDGYVFRIDLRLRPASEVSPLAIPIVGALSHYESSALAWERAAFIRARSCAGDVAAGEDFLSQIRPFVWRRSLDFGAIDEIRRLTHRIRDKQRGPREPQPGYNVKLGRGGIREIEFFAQTHQLIHGGRDRSLRLRQTRPALDALAEAGRISAEDAQVLGDCYDGLRVIEHRLQMVADQQTHTLPAGESLDNVAQLHGLADGGALIDHLMTLTAPVADRFDALLAEDKTAVPVSANDAMRTRTLAPELAERVQQWTDGRYQPLRSPAAIAAFEAVRPQMLAAFAQSDDPARTLARCETLLTRLPSAINLFRLLEARPGLLQLLTDILTLAPPMADELARRPELLDALIDRTALDLPGNVSDLAEAMRSCEEGDDYELALNRIRIVTGETRFALGVQLLEAAQDPLDVAAALSRTAEAAMEVAAEAAGTEFASKHGRIAGSELLVLGLGRFGGGALTHASDLDIVYLFSGEQESESDGARPLGATLYYNRLAQRVSAALSVPTAQGALYEVDTRLRPQGAQGPLAVSLDSFERYQQEDAWTWEHMALTRSRVLIGSPEARVRLEAIIDAVLRRPRDPDKLRADLLEMRNEMAKHKHPKGPLDAKLLRGGLVDLEFLIHHAQLRYGVGLTPDLDDAIAQLAAEGLLSEELGAAHDVMTRLLVGTRLLAPDLEPPGDAAGVILARLCRTENFADLLAQLTNARRDVAAAWQTTFDETLELEA